VTAAPGKSSARDRAERELLDAFRRLGERERASLLDFAAFLAARSAPDEAVPAVAHSPLDIPRPAGESVIKALKRLSATYPMLDKQQLMNEATALVSQHVMEGRAAVEVIDELEVVFRRHYEVHAGDADPVR